ncbi:MAG: translation initiation factor IF-2 subunit beta [Candidatus Marsarchaeota archaeon]|nr:translation initiation factor IF-2 subunit beta [Candidatus Marsarchaeota archaeon]MCL5094405.1 translation initiation factor IF-2 subunit beta [Candidatus Marsarchaeota archaeon]
MKNEEYFELLDRAFSKRPDLAIDISDFKIPKVDAFIEGNKTIIRNIGIIADKGRRKIIDIARFLSKELGVPVNNEEQRIIINGKFTTEDLDKRIEKYFHTYVICKECKKPDSHLEVIGGGMYNFICEACGARYGVKYY